MKNSFLFITALLILKSYGQGFNTSSINWNCPNGGIITSGITVGYNATSGVAATNDNTGSQTWGMTDLTGDGKPDLVVVAQMQGGYVTSFSPTSSQYWKVYQNNGSSFSASPLNWSLPAGGLKYGGINYGFEALNDIAFASDDVGSQSWSLSDFTGDGKPDLVVTAQLQGGYVTSFSPTSGQYWKVYQNTGSGFSATPVNWSLPNGGKISGGITYGFDGLAGSATATQNTGSQTWSVSDLTGDGKPDLVITAQLQAGNVTSFSPTSGQYWKVYQNTGSGFSATPQNWTMPNGGKILAGITYGFNAAGGLATAFEDTGSQSWGLNDLTGDGKADMVVTAQLQAGNVTSFSPTSGQYWKVYQNTGSGFSATPQNWSLPNGGKISAGLTLGYYLLGGAANSTDNTGSQSWTTTDLTGDGKPDLIITAQLQAGNVTSFSPTSSQYWKMYQNTGTGFSTTVVNWSAPAGGLITSGITYGFNSAAGVATVSQNTGSQTWSLADMNGDDKPDLVVAAQIQGGNVTSFSPTSNQYWKVYLNTSPVGLNEINHSADFSFYPNPATDEITISGIEKYAEISVFDLQGKYLNGKTTNTTVTTLDISDLPAGFYLISIKTPDGSVTKKFLKQ